MDERNYRAELREAEETIAYLRQTVQELRETKWSYESDEIIRYNKEKKVFLAIQIAAVATFALILLFGSIPFLRSWYDDYNSYAGFFGTGCAFYYIAYYFLTRKIGK